MSRFEEWEDSIQDAYMWDWAGDYIHLAWLVGDVDDPQMRIEYFGDYGIETQDGVDIRECVYLAIVKEGFEWDDEE